MMSYVEPEAPYALLLMDLFNYDQVIIILYVQSLKSQFRQQFVEINYIFGFNLETKHKNFYDSRYILILYSIHTVCQLLHDCMLIHK